jgi:hypothetical protein
MPGIFFFKKIGATKKQSKNTEYENNMPLKALDSVVSAFGESAKRNEIIIAIIVIVKIDIRMEQPNRFV